MGQPGEVLALHLARNPCLASALLASPAADYILQTILRAKMNCELKEEHRIGNKLTLDVDEQFHGSIDRERL